MTMKKHKRLWLLGSLLALAAVFALSAARPLAAQTQNILIESDDSKHAGEFVIAINKSQILKLDVPFQDILVGNPEIADVLPLTDRSVYVLGKELGSTNLTIYAANKRLIAVVDLVVSVDIEGLKARLYELMPNERIEVRPANGSVILSGAVSGSVHLARVLAVAERYAPDMVTNLLSVKGSQQVLLEVRFAEISRTASKQLGLNTQVFGDKFSVTSGSALIGALTGFGIPQFASDAFAAGEVNLTAGSANINFLFDALEEKGVVKTLAEPNLIAMSGDTASFLAGGEFPVPVSQNQRSGGDAGGSSSAISIEFKEFGVSLSFTPTVLENGLINLVVSPEVSRLDRSVTVNVGNLSIPGLSTRRAKTTVELRDGQSFAIAGLIQNDFEDTVRQFPILADLPIIGALLRSSEFKRNESELVIIVTPHLVQPAPAGSLKTPVDDFMPPTTADLFLMGKTEGSARSVLGSPSGRILSAAEAGGIDGKYGHIIK